ncbi:hypothetical protein AWI43_15760 [Streptomyces sp. WAC04657]|nr:hypothetical protein AWI43_15760 [Streptomyces sp. WAC04657]
MRTSSAAIFCALPSVCRLAQNRLVPEDGTSSCPWGYLTSGSVRITCQPFRVAGSRDQTNGPEAIVNPFFGFFGSKPPVLAVPSTYTRPSSIPTTDTWFDVPYGSGTVHASAPVSRRTARRTWESPPAPCRITPYTVPPPTVATSPPP